MRHPGRRDRQDSTGKPRLGPDGTAAVRRQRPRPQPGRARSALLLSYLAVWARFGAVALAADTSVHATVDHWPWLDNHSGLILAATLALVGAFQFSSLKDRCLTACRDPLSMLWLHYRRGARAWRLGWHHALNCLGCCWALTSSRRLRVPVVFSRMDFRWSCPVLAEMCRRRAISAVDRPRAVSSHTSVSLRGRPYLWPMRAATSAGEADSMMTAMVALLPGRVRRSPRPPPRRRVCRWRPSRRRPVPGSWLGAIQRLSWHRDCGSAAAAAMPVSRGVIPADGSVPWRICRGYQTGSALIA